jgi:hypothetical protein
MGLSGLIKQATPFSKQLNWCEGSGKQIAERKGACPAPLFLEKFRGSRSLKLHREEKFDWKKSSICVINYKLNGVVFYNQWLP